MILLTSLLYAMIFYFGFWKETDRRVPAGMVGKLRLEVLPNNGS